MARVPLDTPDQVRDFLRLCLDPGEGYPKRTVARAAEIMPDWLAAPLTEHAPHLGTLRARVEGAEAYAVEERARYTEALRAWIARETVPAGKPADAPPPLRASTRNSPAPVDRPHLGVFAENAGVEAIRAHLDARRADRRGLDRHIADLESLLAHREDSIAAGAWPPPAAVEVEGATA